VDTTALRVLAIILIANSHLEDLYPFRPLAADGLIGNALFFMLSGFGLAISLGKSESRFPDWYHRRLRRLYPGLWLTVLVGYCLLQGGWRDWTARDFAWNLVWPTRFTFVGQIVLYYPAFFLIKAARSERVEYGVMLGLAATYLAVAVTHYNLHTLSWLFYFQVMLFGGVWAGRVERMGRDGRRGLAVLGLTMLVYVGVKLAMVTGRIPMNVVALHTLTLAIVYTLLELTATVPVQSLTRRPRLGPTLGLVAGLTLEIYLVHGLVYESRPVAALPFPVNIAAFWAATLPLAWVLSKASARLLRLASPAADRGAGRAHFAALFRGKKIRTITGANCVPAVTSQSRRR
jgi:peptidoglycan/LPS O-acetylase OafA/YrhL